MSSYTVTIQMDADNQEDLVRRIKEFNLNRDNEGVSMISVVSEPFQIPDDISLYPALPIEPIIEGKHAHPAI